MLKIALLVVAYLNQQRLSTLALSVDIEVIKAAMQQVIHRLQAEAMLRLSLFAFCVHFAICVYGR
jgi:hypothetical protein